MKDYYHWGNCAIPAGINEARLSLGYTFDPNNPPSRYNPFRNTIATTTQGCFATSECFTTKTTSWASHGMQSGMDGNWQGRTCRFVKFATACHRSCFFVQEEQWCREQRQILAFVKAKLYFEREKERERKRERERERTDDRIWFYRSRNCESSSQVRNNGATMRILMTNATTSLAFENFACTSRTSTNCSHTTW